MGAHSEFSIMPFQRLVKGHCIKLNAVPYEAEDSQTHEVRLVKGKSTIAAIEK